VAGGRGWVSKQTSAAATVPWGHLTSSCWTLRPPTRPALRALGTVPSRVETSETGLRAAVVIDQLDYVNFPQRGYRIVGEAALSEGNNFGRTQRVEASAMGVKTFGRHTLNVFAAAEGASQQENRGIGRYTLGGFHRLSGYHEDQLLGSYVLFSRLTWYMSLATTPLLARGYFVGATAEVGNAYASREALRSGDLRTGTSLFLGADTALGPLYLSLIYAPRGHAGIVLFLGRP